MTALKSIAILLLAATCVRAGGPPPTEEVPVTDTYHGTKVADAYRWLEDGSDDSVRAWSDAQNAYARGILDHLASVDEIRARTTEIYAARTVSYSDVTYSGGHLFAIKRHPPKQHPFLVVMPSAESPHMARVIVDPNQLDPHGGTSIDWYVPSHNGKLVAVSLSKGGSESGDVHIYQTLMGREVHEVVPRVNGGTAGGDVAWTPDGSGFFYTRYPRGSERPPADMHFYQQICFHRLGTPTDKDTYEYGKDLPRIAEIQLDMDGKTGRLIATVQDGDGGEFAHFLRSTDGQWKQFSRFGDKTLQAAFGPNDDLFLVSRRDAPRGKILRIPIDRLDVSAAETIVPQGKDSIVSEFGGAPTVMPTDTRLYVEYQLGGPSEIRVFDLEGRSLPAPKQLPVSTVGGLMRLEKEEILFYNASYIAPPARYHYDPTTGRTSRPRLATDSPVDFSNLEVVREFATSQDGTKVPVNILLPKTAKRDGSNPCVVTGYGGYQVNITPSFRASRQILLEQGVIYAVANLRGGGEYGAEWHRQGNLTHKQNVFDDFAAVLQHLINRKYTSSKKLAITGGSNGGLLMGALVTQHPDLAAAVVSHVGIYDMLRVELSPNGAFNIPEFGTVTNPDHFRALHAYSPYHNVRDGVRYPPTLFLTGANDPRVDPMQSRKMTARLQAASTTDTPILLRTSANTGHGGGTPLAERINNSVDANAFIFQHLGVQYRPTAKRPG